ncbi:MAG TPA: nucleotidyltransferase family protein [Solirubrobacteraceae bacterium]|jgi:hypothetical protein|nr:nucleotidyltransferase family protein [Solirubrobacteraceae bacterium]
MRAEESAWPTARQRELILAATAASGVADQAWKRWQHGGELLDIDQASYRLLPLLWSNRQAAGIGEDQLALLKGCYRQSLWQVHRTLAAGMSALDALDSPQVPTMLLKGAAILSSRPAQMGVRPMDDVDILVPRAAARAAIDLLEADGWRAVHGPLRPLGVWHAIDLERAEHERVDLHWSATTVPGDDRAIWEDARPAKLLGRSVQIPSPTFQLLITCVHGVGANPAPVRWLADALLILRGVDEIDWVALVNEARARRVTAALADALRGLREHFDAPVPVGVLGQLGGRRALGERLANRVASADGRGAVYLIELHRYRRLRAIGDPDRARSFLGHCARRWGFDSSASLARAALPRLVQLARHGRADPWSDFAREGR